MDLSDCKDAWFFDEKYKCWCLEDILYTDRATTPQFQRLSIFVPEPYMKEGGQVSPAGEMNGYTSRTVPVIFENNSAGYMQMPHVWLDGPRCYAHPYLERGYVYVTCGNRGHETKNEKGEYCGRSPVNLVDLKTAIRFLRHNAKHLPGDFDRLISIGWSAGGAMSTLLAVTGNNKNFDPYLRENGAFMDESDAVYASQIYCPIIDLEHADLAYEWMFSADPENEASHAGPAGVMTAFEEALSGLLQKDYIEYFNSLELKNPADGTKLTIGEDGRSGSGYMYLMEKLNESASIYLKKLENGELPETYTVEEYLKGEYTYMVPDFGGPADEPDDASLMQGHAGPGVSLQNIEKKPDRDEPDEPVGLGEMLSRPPKGVEYKHFEPPMKEIAGNDKTSWLKWDGQKASISDLDTYVLKHRRRMKPCTSFDILANGSGENKVFGTATEAAVHFNSYIAKDIAALRERFPEEYEKYYEAYAAVEGDQELARRVYLINPLNYIDTEEQSDAASFYRIRVGASDADTSLSVAMTLALKLEGAGKNVDYQLVWDQPHSEADYPGEIIRWIDSIC